MITILKLKTALLTPIIKFIVKHPGIMKSGIFLKAMVIFPSLVSKTYDDRISGSSYDYHAALDEGLTRIFNKPQKILDICTGTGFAAIKSAEVFPDSFIYAVDHIAQMLDIARNKAKAGNINNIVFKIGNAVKLDFKDNDFDFIVTSNAPVYLSEASRVLKPQGLILVVFSFSGAAFLPLESEIKQYLYNNGIKLLEMKNTGKGVYILGEKYQNNTAT